MNKIFFIGFIAATFAMTSCDKVKDAVEDFQKDQAPSYVESKDGLTITVSYAKDGIGSETEAKFTVDKSGEEHLLSDTICTSFVTKASYAVESVAKQVYEETKSESNEKVKITYDGKKTITSEFLEYTDMEKPFVVWALETIYETYQYMYSGKQPGIK